MENVDPRSVWANGFCAGMLCRLLCGVESNTRFAFTAHGRDQCHFFSDYCRGFDCGGAGTYVHVKNHGVCGDYSGQHQYFWWLYRDASHVANV